ncbi:proline-rich protein 19 [Accipiter gentilis]|uniref:proline-rich protein 19 n=1 Tax=Astur gentilis TaxID=8957 RepID=UPI00210F8807|nr:proline-rich protein 19 [Accipiter gentilis]
MSHHRSRRDIRDVGDPHPRRGPHPSGPGPGPGRIKRRKTKRERDTAKFGRKVPSGRQRGAGLPPRRLLPLWGGRPPASPLPAPKTVVITQNRLCQHQGMFNREVKSVNVERLLSPCPGQDLGPPSKPPLPRDPSPAPEGDPHPSEQDPLPSSPQAPQTEGEKGVPAELTLRELAGRLRAILGHTMAFPGRDLVGERRQAILAALLHRHRALPDLSLLLAHRNRGTDAAPPGCWSPRTPERELSGGGSAEQGDFGEQKQSWDTTPPYSSTPLQATVSRQTPTYPARPGTPSPIFGGDGQKRETPFSWTSGEEDNPRRDSPAPLFQPPGERTPSWGDPHQHRGPLPHVRLLPGSPPTRVSPGCTCRDPSFAQSHAAPQPTPAAFGEDAGEGCSWSRRPPIAPPAFSPVAPQHRHPPHRSITAQFAPRCPDLCCRTSLDAQTPDTWSPEASRRLVFAPGWPYDERRAQHCHHHPLRHQALRHGSHRLGRPSVPPSAGTCCWQPSLERRPPPVSRRRWDWEDWWDAAEPRCRRGLGEQAWLRVLRHLPLSCLPPSEALERGGSPLPHPETWGCPCTGLY